MAKRGDENEGMNKGRRRERSEIMKDEKVLRRSELSRGDSMAVVCAMQRGCCVRLFLVQFLGPSRVESQGESQVESRVESRGRVEEE